MEASLARTLRRSESTHIAVAAAVDVAVEGANIGHGWGEYHCWRRGVEHQDESPQAGTCTPAAVVVDVAVAVDDEGEHAGDTIAAEREGAVETCADALRGPSDVAAPAEADDAEAADVVRAKKTPMP